jgi:hypothetical protein
MNEQEYVSWVWRDMFDQILPALAIYAVVLIAYWGFVA